MPYLIPTIILSFLFSFAILRISKKRGWFDMPDEERKIHKNPTPNLGGIAMFFAFWIMITLFMYFNQVQGEYLKYIIGLFVGSLILYVVGIIDDQRKISPNAKFIAQIIAGLTVISAGVGIAYLNNPFGGFIFLNQINIPILNISGTIYQITLLADIFALVWIVGMINVVNFLDGLDGLASGVAAIAFLVIYLLSINPAVDQPLSAIIALVALGAVIGFLPFNLSPAKMFMGDTGSMFLGIILSTLAIVSGGKLATALLVLGLPLFDGVWVAASRVLKGKKPWTADRSHLHHKLIDLGFSRRNIVLIYWVITAIFGAIALLGGAKEKFVALVILLIAMAIGMILVNRRLKRLS